MHELLHNDKSVIRPADKGSGIVIVNREDYISKLQEEIKKIFILGDRRIQSRQSS